MRSALLLLLPIAASLACTQRLDSDFEGTITMRTSAEGSSQELLLEVQRGQVRFGWPSDPQQAKHGLYDNESNKMVVYFDADKRYLELDFQRPGLAENTNPQSSTLEETGRKDKIAGVECEQIVVHDPSGSRSEVCAVFGVSIFDLARLRGGPGASLSDKKVFALRSVEFDAEGKERSRMEVTKIDRKSIDPARFAVPTGYTKQELLTP